MFQTTYLFKEFIWPTLREKNGKVPICTINHTLIETMNRRVGLTYLPPFPNPTRDASRWEGGLSASRERFSRGGGKKTPCGSQVRGAFLGLPWGY
jgi:hypothetical protein